MKEQREQEGVISTRKCPACGHHEVGFIDRAGTFHPLRPGQRVLVVPASAGGAPAVEPEVPGTPPPCETGAERDSPPAETGFYWVPEPLSGRRSFCLVFGVRIHDQEGGEMTPGRYRRAYLEKLRRLIAREPSGTLAATLDRHFAAPYLAAGTPEQIAENLWRELEEVRAPALIVASWFENPGEDIVARAGELVSWGDDSGGHSMDLPGWEEEMDGMGLDVFFELVV